MKKTCDHSEQRQAIKILEALPHIDMPNKFNSFLQGDMIAAKHDEGKSVLNTFL